MICKSSNGSHTQKLINNPPIIPLRYQLKALAYADFKSYLSYVHMYLNPYSCRNNFSVAVSYEILLSSCSTRLPLHKGVVLLVL